MVRGSGSQLMRERDPTRPGRRGAGAEHEGVTQRDIIVRGGAAVRRARRVCIPASPDTTSAVRPRGNHVRRGAGGRVGGGSFFLGRGACARGGGWTVRQARRRCVVD